MSFRRTTPTADEFVIQLKKEVLAIDSLVVTFCQHFVAEIADQGMVTPGRWGPGTPIDTSFARRSWRFGLDQPTPGPTAPVKDGELPPPLDLSNVMHIELTRVCYLTSDCVYMEDLEWGHSQQAPAGMIRTTLSDAQAIANYVMRHMNTRRAA